MYTVHCTVEGNAEFFGPDLFFQNFRKEGERTLRSDSLAGAKGGINLN
jgi:hypothetical protein